MAKRKQARRSADKKKPAAKKLGRASPKKPRAKPLSLYPLSFEDVMKRLVGSRSPKT
jgi:hypothetical protein